MGERLHSNDLTAKLKRNLKTYKICTILLIILNLTIGYFWGTKTHSFESHIIEHTEKYPLIDPSRNFISQNDFIVNIQPLREKLNQMVDQYGREKVSLYLEYLNTGANISINPELYIWPASLLKLPVAMVTMKKVEEGEWKLSNELVLFQEDRDYDSGDPENMFALSPVGTRFTIETLVRESLKNSDNTAHKILSRNLGDKEILDFSRVIGLEDISNESGQFSSKEYSRLFRSLYTASYLNRESSQTILGWLAESTFKEYLAPSVPENILFAHKYAKYIEKNVYSDSGIVYIKNRPFLITVMTQGSIESVSGSEEAKAKEFMNQISREAYSYFSLYNP